MPYGESSCAEYPTGTSQSMAQWESSNSCAPFVNYGSTAPACSASGASMGWFGSASFTTNDLSSQLADGLHVATAADVALVQQALQSGPRVGHHLGVLDTVGHVAVPVGHLPVVGVAGAQRRVVPRQQRVLGADAVCQLAAAARLRGVLHLHERRRVRVLHRTRVHRQHVAAPDHARRLDAVQRRHVVDRAKVSEWVGGGSVCVVTVSLRGLRAKVCSCAPIGTCSRSPHARVLIASFCRFLPFSLHSSWGTTWGDNGYFYLNVATAGLSSGTGAVMLQTPLSVVPGSGASSNSASSAASTSNVVSVRQTAVGGGSNIPGRFAEFDLMHDDAQMVTEFLRNNTSSDLQLTSMRRRIIGGGYHVYSVQGSIGGKGEW